MKGFFELLKRAAAGFFAGLIVSLFVAFASGLLPTHGDLSQPEIDDFSDKLIVAQILIGACSTITTVVAIGYGRVLVNPYWLQFVLAFGLISVIPVWPTKSAERLPFATLYLVESQADWVKLILLAAHLALAAGLTAAWNLWRRWSDGGHAKSQEDSAAEQKF